ncbi:hypothetical protein CR105_26680 [Massilia eurypsychrophila]|uniref:histidine kinase n=1 Tax=Massilia eurypsychrophila TaxID=1485217 RepID=A0A2G8T7L4_9BURK|nr:response regulator [Massilia eurypsychrophila]PIL41994.1 hypothetical protein CR105_26680 [Massilia eurypsychrophila]
MGHEVVISVRDTGVGLSAEALPNVFELFSQVGKTVDRSHGGLGIGLALVKKLVEMHSGEVTAESPGMGQGCTFTVRLPLALANVVEVTAATNSVRATSHATPRRILVVDDNIDAAELLSMLLVLAGHTVETVHTGPAALQTARANVPDVIFLDIGLPGMSGYEVAHRLRSDATTSKVILVALTGWGTEEDRQRAIKAGFDGHLTKPVQSERLHEIIDSFYEKDNRENPRV